MHHTSGSHVTFSAAIACTLAIATIAVCPLPTSAQIRFENGSSPTQDPSDGNVIDVSDGTVAGSTLFLRFSRYDLDSGSKATYVNTTVGADPTTVFNAIFDSKPSSINGEISSQYNADFYFLNPYGIVFGPDASFDIGGSLFITSADAVHFNSGEIFEVQAGGSIPTIDASPVSFGFLGANPGRITFNGSDIALEDGEALHVIAGDIEFRDTAVEINSGLVRLVSVGSAGNFELATDDISSFEELGDILITSQRTSDDEALPTIDVGGDGGGQIVGRARNITFRDGVIATGNETTSLGDPDANAIDIRVSEDLMIEGESEILSDTEGTAKGGNILLQADTLTITGDSEIASDVEDGASGDGGRITINARIVRLQNNVEISSDTDFNSTGAGGSISISASELLDIEIDPPTEEAGILANSEGTGNAGTISIDTSELRLRGGEISTRADQADGGGILINAYRGLIAIQDGRVTASVSTGGTGGSLELLAGAVILDNAQLVAQAPAGTGGNIIVTSDVFSAANSLVSASGRTDGTVEIESLDVDLAASATPLDSHFLDATSLLQSRCAARQDDTAGGRFSVLTRRGQPVSSEVVLLTFDTLHTVGGTRDSQSIGAGGAERRDLEARATTAIATGQKLEAEGTITGIDLAIALLRWGQSEQLLGRYAESIAPLQRAAELAKARVINEEEPMLLARALSSLGTTHVTLRDTDRAIQILELAADRARKHPDSRGGAGVFNNLANAYMIRGEVEPALETFEESARAGSHTGDVLAQVRALAGGARTALTVGRYLEAEGLLLNAHAKAKALPVDPQTPRILIHIAKSFEALALSLPKQRETSILNAYYTLRRASELAEKFGDGRTAADALGNSALLYQREERTDEALLLVRRALRAAEHAQAPESLYRWHWLEGQLLWERGEHNSALASYRRAAGILEVTRGEALSRYGSSEAHFERGVAPVYIELINRLLQRADEVEAQNSDALPLMLEARATLERFKVAELRNYFRDDCIAELESKVRDLDELAVRAAVVYPISLPDRMELLVTLPDGLQRFRVEVGAQELTKVARNFRNRLARPFLRGFEEPAQQLYDWLVRPYVAALEAQGVDTLVFVPDGALRSVPFSALHDGEQFLVLQYATAVTPGLGLIDPKPLDRKQPRILIAGLSESVQGFSALPNVITEVEEVNAIYQGDVLLNEDFQIDRIEQKIEDNPFSIVHIASHAEFNGDHDASYILTYDGKLNMNRLTRTIGATRYKNQPLELLVLSACETAAGDDRAALGLAGVAIQAGARSALGSLWSISDSAAQKLVVTFYRELQNPNVSKAQALQRAQLALLAQKEFEHPFFWSPFLLINNWL